jgi:hypothetical protein
MNDLQEFETRLRRLHPANQKRDEALEVFVRGIRAPFSVALGITRQPMGLLSRRPFDW